MVEVVHMRTCNPPWGQPGDVRIDRATIWGNPFGICGTNTRDYVCDLYEKHYNDMQHVIPKVLDIAWIASAKRLGCWCKPHHRCHGDFLKKKIEEYLDKQQTRLSDS